MPRPGALDGIRVLDLATPLAEATGRVLADLGAEVIKVEPPEGCGSRRLGPFVDGRDGDVDASLYWRAFGLGKKSVVVDLATVAGRDTLLALVRTADVLIESYTPGTLDAWGMGSAELRAVNPSLLHVSVTPFGQTGPEAASPATALTLSAAGGFLNCQGDRDRPPVPVGVPECNHSGAVQAAADVILALGERDRSGLGQHLDSSLQAAIVGTLLFITGYSVLGRDAPGMGDDRLDPPQGIPGLTIPVFARTADGFLGMTLVLGTPGARSLGRMMTWAASHGAIDADLATHDWAQLFALLGAGTIRAADAQRGIDQLVAFFGSRTKREIHEQAVAGRWLVAPAWDVRDLTEDLQLAARGYWTDVEGTSHPGPFAQMSATPITYAHGAPRLGEHQHLVAATDRRPNLADTVTRDTVTTGTVTPQIAVSPAIPRSSALAGLKVADFSWVGAGPLISRDLANLGATVLRVETETVIDPLRIIPPWKDGIPNHATGHCMANFNQSKIGLALDLANPRARDVAMRLVDWADVVIESFVPGTAAKFGLDAATLRARKPDLLMLSSCMRGQTGPERGYTGFGLQGAALAGFVSVTGWADRLPAGPFAAYTDFIAPRYSLAALGAALHHRNRTGEGQYIDLSQIEAAIHFLEPQLLDYTVNGRIAGLRGVDSDTACPHGVYRTVGTERYIAIAAETAAQWRALRETMPPLRGFADAAFDELHVRIAHRAAIEAAVAEACADEEPFVLAEGLRRAGVPAYVVLRASDLNRDEQLMHRRFFVELDHPRIGPNRYDGPVTTFSDTPHAPTHAGPVIGQHTELVLRDYLGYDDDEISDLAAAGALT